MVMTENEIVRDYKAAKNKRQQIEILADLNATTVDEIKAVLKSNNVDLRGGNYRAKKPATINEDFEKEVEKMKKEVREKRQAMARMYGISKTINL